MDTNGDGVITRSEWRGNTQSFRQHDWNNDGVLSGDELRAGGANSSGQVTDWTVRGFRTLDLNGDGRVTRSEWSSDLATFRRVDRDNNNVITRAEFLGGDDVVRTGDEFDALDLDGSASVELDEWRGSRVAFNRLDRNRDGVLSRREFNLGDVARARDEYGDDEVRSVRVDPRQRWTPTGIFVRAGDLVTWRALGTIVMSDDGSDTATPAGSTKGRRASNAPLSDASAGGLLMSIDGNVVRFAGQNGSFRANGDGELLLGVNDDHLADNSGEYRVTVNVSR